MLGNGMAASHVMVVALFFFCLTYTNISYQSYQWISLSLSSLSFHQWFLHRRQLNWFQHLHCLGDEDNGSVTIHHSERVYLIKRRRPFRIGGQSHTQRKAQGFQKLHLWSQCLCRLQIPQHEREGPSLTHSINFISCFHANRINQHFFFMIDHEIVVVLISKIHT